MNASHAKLLLLFLASVYNPIERMKYNTKIAKVVNINIKEIVLTIEVKLDQLIFITCSLVGTFNTSFNQFIILLNIWFNLIGIIAVSLKIFIKSNPFVNIMWKMWKNIIKDLQKYEFDIQ